MERNFQLGQKVERLGSTKDYTTGRIGFIVDMNQDRIRVNWKYEKDGRPVLTCNANTGNGIRTWVSKKFLKIA